MKYAATQGAVAPPTWADVLISACAGPRRPGGKHWAMTRAALGSAPAAPAQKGRGIKRRKKRLSPRGGGRGGGERSQTQRAGAKTPDHHRRRRASPRREP